MTSREMTKIITDVLDDMKATDVKVLQIEEISTVADYFVITTGNSSTQVKAFSDKIEMKLKENGEMPKAVEGYRSDGWILLDYYGVVVHIFTPEAREFYDLDRLWQDAENVDISSL